MGNNLFQERLVEAMKLRGITASEISNRTGLSKPTLSYYVNGKWIAKQKSVYLIAEVLRVSPAWLMGEDVPMEKPKNLMAISDAEKRLLAYYRALNEIGKSKAISNIYDLSKIDDYKEKGDDENGEG